MVTIGVISDTHLMRPSAELAKLVEPGGAFENVEMILHAGDIASLLVLDSLAPKEVIAVCGNMCGNDVSARLRSKEVIRIEGVKIGLIHGWGSRMGLEQRILPEFDGVDAIVYGHTHTPANHEKNGILLFNPGSFYERAATGCGGTVGLLTVDQDTVTGEIIYL